MNKITRQNGTTIIKIDHNFTAAATKGLRKEILGLLDDIEEGLILDLEGVSKIDSIGLGILAATQNSLGKLGKKLTVINASKNICHLFAMTHLNRFFTVASCDE